MKNWIGISLGDITGIGPEVTLKALASELPADEARYLLIGDTEPEPLGRALSLPRLGEVERAILRAIGLPVD